MSGTKAGGVKAAKTNKLRYGEEFYTTISIRGGQAKVKKGFARMDPAKLKAVSSIGGKRSRKPL